MSKPTDPEVMTVFIPGIPSNTNRSGHMGSGKWQPIKERAHFRKLTAELARDTARALGWTMADHSLITARHISPVKRRRDPLGLAERLKALMDGLVDAEVIPDDDEKHIEVVLAASAYGNPAGILLTIYKIRDDVPDERTRDDLR